MSAATSALRRSSVGCARRSSRSSWIQARASRTAASASAAATGSAVPDWKKKRVDPVGPVAEAVTIGDREARHLGDDDRRQGMGEVGDQLDPAASACAAPGSRRRARRHAPAGSRRGAA